MDRKQSQSRGTMAYSRLNVGSRWSGWQGQILSRGTTACHHWMSTSDKWQGQISSRGTTACSHWMSKNTGRLRRSLHHFGRETGSGYGGGSFNGDSKRGNQSMQGLNGYGIRGSFNGKLQTDGERSMQVVMQGLNRVRVVLTRNSKRTGNDPCKSICKD